MPSISQLLATVAAAAALTLGGAASKLIAAEHGCDIKSDLVSEIVLDLKASTNLPLWEHESCEVNPRLATIRTCTWNDGHVSLWILEGTPRVSLYLAQKSSSSEAVQTFHSVAQLVIGQIRRLDSNRAWLDDVAIADAFAGKNPYLRQELPCFILAGKRTDSDMLYLGISLPTARPK
jgi:hypothetical protein